MPYKDEQKGKEYQRQYREKYKDKRKEYQKQYRDSHDFSEYKKEWYQSKRFDKYGITKQVFEVMLNAQKHACAICLTPFAEQLRPHVDHDHVTKAVRGLLCLHCNTGIGQLRDSPKLVYRALCYLEDSK